MIQVLQKGFRKTNRQWKQYDDSSPVFEGVGAHCLVGLVVDHEKLYVANTGSSGVLSESDVQDVYPWLIPTDNSDPTIDNVGTGDDPMTITATICKQDQFIIFANFSFWEYITPMVVGLIVPSNPKMGIAAILIRAALDVICRDEKLTYEEVQMEKDGPIIRIWRLLCSTLILKKQRQAPQASVDRVRPIIDLFVGYLYLCWLSLCWLSTYLFVEFYLWSVLVLLASGYNAL